MMKVEYDTLNVDLTEAHWRFFCQNGNFYRNRIVGAIATFVVAGLVGLMVANAFIWSVWISPLMAAIAGVSYFRQYESTTRSAFGKTVERNYGSRLPAKTSYVITDTHLICDCLGAKVSFLLDDLEALTSDDEYLEIHFGGTNACFLPNRAFNTDSQRIEFIESVKRESGRRRVLTPAPHTTGHTDP